MKQILTAVMVISFVSMLAGAGTLAYFSDTEVSMGNTFTAGNHELKIKDGDEDWRDGVTATWTLSNMKPGDSTWGKIGFQGNGGENLNISCSYTIDEGSAIESETNHSNSADDFAKKMIITEMRYYGRGNLDLLTTDNYDSDYKPNPHSPGPMVEDSDNDGKISLYDLTSGVDVRPPIPNTNTWLNMTIKFDENAGNDFQGDTLNLTMIFTLNH